MIYPVGILIAAYLAVSHAQREVGIGIEGTLRIPFAQTLDIGRVESVSYTHLIWRQLSFADCMDFVSCSGFIRC